MPKLRAFEVENFRSFYTRQRVEFGTTASRRVTALYGPNSSGKSNLIRALHCMQHCVFHSANANWKLPYEPFLLKEWSSKSPTVFLVEFECEGRILFYEFSYTSDHIVSEKLQEESLNSKKRRTVFARNEQGDLNSTAAKNGFGKKLGGKTRAETLLITKGQEDNNKYSSLLFCLFRSLLFVVDEAQTGRAPHFVEMLRHNEDLQEKTLDLLRKCDFAIRGIKIEQIPISDEMLDGIPFVSSEYKEELRRRGGTTFKTIHAVRDEERTVVAERELDFWNQESMGTRNFFEIAVFVIAALDNASTIFIDEFGAYMHPTLANSIIQLFKKEEEESKAAHLIFATHGTAMMDNDLERDEILLVEKTMDEESRLLPLSKAGANKTDAIGKRYRSGLYGAVPLVRE